MIPVTKPFLPPRQEFDAYVFDIWNRSWLTNNGPLLNELELKLKEYLDLDHLAVVNNGTVGLQVAIKALDLQGEVITTPFSYVATSSSLVWMGCKPVFVDINPKTLNIDTAKIETRITPETTAILATHVYGNPCDVKELTSIAKRNGLKLIFDAAHAFGVRLNKQSIFRYGDISVASFHATKLFHTIEGGAVITNSKEVLHKISWLRNFGHDGTERFFGCGINGKNCEFHSAMGILNLKYIDEIIQRRRYLSEYYISKLSNFRYERPMLSPRTEYNYAYFPVILESEAVLQKMMNILNTNWIFPRRYFFPSLNTLPFLAAEDCPISDDISRRVLCLPLYYDLKEEEIDMIVRLMLRVQNN